MAYEYIKRAYGLDFAPGQRVKHTVTGYVGEVRREDKGMGHYVMVRFDNLRQRALPCHPEELVAAP